MPSASAEATDALLSAADPVQQWVSYCVERKEGALLTLEEAWQDYCWWVPPLQHLVAKRGAATVGRQAFKNRLSELVGRMPVEQMNNRHTGNRKLTNVWSNVAPAAPGGQC